MTRAQVVAGAAARLLVALALGIVVVAWVLPVGALAWRSFRVQEVALRDGSLLRAAGSVTRIDDAFGRVWAFQVQAGPGEPRIPVRVRDEKVLSVRSVASLAHYASVFGDPRTTGLLRHSLLLAAGAALGALLLGLPLAWLLGRTDLPGRRLLAALVLAPAILPPLVISMGSGRVLGDALHGALGLEGGTLQLTAAALLFALGLFPIVAFLVAGVLAAVPAGPWEAARLLGGGRAALRHVVLPAVLPAAAGAALLVFVLALSDFAVPDVLGFTLPQVRTPANVFPTEILLQWKQEGNHGRAVATGAPLLVGTVLFLLLALALLRRSPLAPDRTGRRRPRVALGRGRAALAWALALLLLGASFVLPMAAIGGWGLGAGTSAAGQEGGGAAVGRLGDLAATLDATPGWQGDLLRWVASATVAAMLAVAVATTLVRWALRGGKGARATVLLLGALPLAVPGLAITVGTTLLWLDVDATWVSGGILRPVLALLARFLPFALLAVWLALRTARPQQEEAAAVLGAGGLVRAVRVWGPPALLGLLAGLLVVLVLALREVDAVILVDPRILPLRLYDKIHFSRRADEANLAFLYVAILLVPAVLAALALSLRRRPGGRPAAAPGSGGQPGAGADGAAFG